MNSLRSSWITVPDLFERRLRIVIWAAQQGPIQGHQRHFLVYFRELIQYYRIIVLDITVKRVLTMLSKLQEHHIKPNRGLLSLSIAGRYESVPGYERPIPNLYIRSS
jgi:hypothetical protein